MGFNYNEIHLEWPKEMGGLNLPDLQAYYQAAQVPSIKVWMLEPYI